jgi:hypothetical protein
MMAGAHTFLISIGAFAQLVPETVAVSTFFLSFCLRSMNMRNMAISVKLPKSRRRSKLRVGRRNRIKKYTINAETATRVAATLRFMFALPLALDTFLITFTSDASRKTKKARNPNIKKVN